MYKGINACYKGALPPADLNFIASLASPNEKIVIRAAVEDTTQAIQIQQACLGLPIKIMFLVEYPNHNLVVELAEHVLREVDCIELLNEPNLNLVHPYDCNEFVLDAHNILKANNFAGDILAGAVCDLRPRSIDYLRDAGVRNWPEDIIISYHRYPQIQTNVKASQVGLDRAEEFNNFLKVIGNHNYACTEHGFHYETIRPYWFWPFITRPAIDEASAAWEYNNDMYILFNQGNKYAMLYQYTDGPTDTGINRFGIKKMDGTYRPIVKSIKNWR